MGPPHHNKPPRLLRFVDLPMENVLALYNEDDNLLQIDRTLYNELSDLDRHIVQRTRAPFIVVVRREGEPPKIKEGESPPPITV